MTTKFLLSTLITTLVLIVSVNAFAGSNHAGSASKAKSMQHNLTVSEDGSANDMAANSMPDTRPQEQEKKSHQAKTEELAHVHHFHKERVKKLKKHHKKFWAMSQVLLVICHILILVCAFLHLTH